jgi:hypothetical protein
VVGVEPVKGGIEIPIGAAQRSSRIRSAGFAKPFGLERDRPDLLALPAAEPIAAAIDQDPAEPRSEAIRVAQRARSLPGCQAGILDRVLRLAPIIARAREND